MTKARRRRVRNYVITKKLIVDSLLTLATDVKEELRRDGNRTSYSALFTVDKNVQIFCDVFDFLTLSDKLSLNDFLAGVTQTPFRSMNNEFMCILSVCFDMYKHYGINLRMSSYLSIQTAKEVTNTLNHMYNLGIQDYMKLNVF